MTSIDPTYFQLRVIASALKLYAQHKLRVNRAYTPKNMIRAAELLTGRKFKPRDYMGAHKALSAKADARLEEIRLEATIAKAKETN